MALTRYLQRLGKLWIWYSPIWIWFLYESKGRWWYTKGTRKACTGTRLHTFFPFLSTFSGLGACQKEKKKRQFCTHVYYFRACVKRRQNLKILLLGVENHFPCNLCLHENKETRTINFLRTMTKIHSATVHFFHRTWPTKLDMRLHTKHFIDYSGFLNDVIGIARLLPQMRAMSQ